MMVVGCMPENQMGQSGTAHNHPLGSHKVPPHHFKLWLLGEQMMTMVMISMTMRMGVMNHWWWLLWWPLEHCWFCPKVICRWEKSKYCWQRPINPGNFVLSEMQTRRWQGNKSRLGRNWSRQAMVSWVLAAAGRGFVQSQDWICSTLKFGFSLSTIFSPPIQIFLSPAWIWCLTICPPVMLSFLCGPILSFCPIN